jgi:sulfate-transporting ATPase
VTLGDLLLFREHSCAATPIEWPLRALEESLLGFSGCVVVISHDRCLLDRIATHMLAFEGDSQVVWFEGNRRQRLGYEADQQHRIKYGKMART